MSTTKYWGVQQVCEVFLELLHNRSLLYCISIAKFEGKDSDHEVIAHVANREAFPNGGHIFDQLSDIMEHGIIVGNRHLQVRLFECHDLACSYALVSRGAPSALGANFCPWCMARKPDSIHVTIHVCIHEDDTLTSIGMWWHMRTSLIQVH
jgi:hypothetical protein